MNIGKKSISTSVTWLVICISSIALLLQSCKQDDDFSDNTNQPWDNIAYHFPVYTMGETTYVVKTDGSLWARGRLFSSSPEANSNGYIQLENNVKKIGNAHQSNRLYVLRKDNSIWRSPVLAYHTEPDFINQKATEHITDNAKDVRTGKNFAVILKYDGTVWAIGENGSGQFGLGTPSVDEYPLTEIATDVKQIATGYSNIYLLKNDNSLWSAGHYTYGKLGYPATDNQYTFKKVMDDVEILRATSNIVIVVKKDRSAWSFGSMASGSSQNPVYPHKIADAVKDVFPMSFTSYLLKENGTLWASGSNSYGQMGMELPNVNPNYIQIAEHVTYMSALSSNHHVVILQNGKYKMAGRNNHKELQQSDVESFSTFTDFVMP